ncbi:unnamed protein product [Peniophora sp. CBMAI 1063]|nr:unnamed protein product [Peniophora sp. CBMAI 1063]
MDIGGIITSVLAAAAPGPSRRLPSFPHSQKPPPTGPTNISPTPTTSSTTFSIPSTATHTSSTLLTTETSSNPRSSPSSTQEGLATSAGSNPSTGSPSPGSTGPFSSGAPSAPSSSHGQASASTGTTPVSSTNTYSMQASSFSSVVVSGSTTFTLVLSASTVAGFNSTQTVLITVTAASGSQSSSPAPSASSPSRGAGGSSESLSESSPPNNIESAGSSATSSSSSTPLPTSESAHRSSEATILGASIGGGVFIIAVVAISLVYLIKRRNARRGHHGRSASRNESFFAAERPLVSPFPTLSRPQSHATATSMAGTLTDEERWAEYRNVHQSPPLLPNHGLVSRDTLLIDHVTEPLSPPARRQDMGYATLSRHSPHSARFPDSERVVAQTAPQDISYVPEDASSSRADNAPSHAMFFSPPSSLSPASASFSQYIVYDGIEVGSLTDTVTTPSGQRVPVAATNSNSFDGFLPSPSMPSPRRSFASLQSESSAGAAPVTGETQFGMAI